MKHLRVLVVASVTFGCATTPQKPHSAEDEHLYSLLRTDREAFAQEVSKDSSSELGRTQAIVRWLTQHFDWKETDYKKRTVQEIIERRGGNCNDLAMVAIDAMKELGVE